MSFITIPITDVGTAASLVGEFSRLCRASGWRYNEDPSYPYPGEMESRYGMAGNKWSRKSMVTPADAFAEYIGQNGYTLKKCDAYLNETHSHFRFIGVVDYIIEDEGGNAIPVIIVPKKDGHPVASKYDSVITELAVVMTLKDYNKGLVIEYDADMRLFGPIYVYPKKHAVTRWNTRINKISKTVSRYFEPMATI